MHGYDSCSQINSFMSFYIYKNSVMAFCEVCFHMFNGYSTHLFFIPLLLSLYNLVFTTLPTIIMIINERIRCKKERFEATTLQYMNLKHNLKYKYGYTFLWWIVSAAIHGICVTTITLHCYKTFNKSFESPKNTSWYDQSTLVYSTVVILV